MHTLYFHFFDPSGFLETVSSPIGPTGFVIFGVIPHVDLCDFRCACKLDMHENRLPQA